MNDRSSKSEHRAVEDSGEETVISISPGLALLVVGVIAAFGIGVFIARMRAPDPQPQTAATQGQAPQATAEAVPQSPVIIGGSDVQDPGTVMSLPSNHPMIGQPMIDIAGMTLDGERRSLSDYAGQHIMLNFWATWCPPCRIEMPWMEEAYRKYQDQGFEILAVDAGERVPPDQVLPTVKGFMDGMGLTFPALLPDDPYSAQLEYRVYGLPSTYMIDPDGTVVDAHRGMYPNRATLLEEVRQLVEGEAEAAAPSNADAAVASP